MLEKDFMQNLILISWLKKCVFVRILKGFKVQAQGEVKRALGH